jgi:DNA-binding transcriptional ArsR family regulator
MWDTMSREAKELNLFRIYKLLDHPVRREIIEFLGEEERLGFKEFKERLKINVGALYYHFDTLSGLIAQDKDRKYVLTDLGKLAYQFLRSKEGRLMELEVEERARIAGPRNRISGYAKSVFFPSGFFMNLYQSPKRHLADVILILAFGSWIMIETKLEPILLFFNFGTSLPPTMIVARLLIGVLIIIAISEIMGRIFFQRSGGNLSLIIGVSFSLLPLFLFPTLLLFEKWGVIILTEPCWVGILQFFLQVWSLCALTSAISLSKGLRMEKAAVISVAVVYLNLGYMYFILHGL